MVCLLFLLGGKVCWLELPELVPDCVGGAIELRRQALPVPLVFPLEGEQTRHLVGTPPTLFDAGISFLQHPHSTIAHRMGRPVGKVTGQLEEDVGPLVEPFISLLIVRIALDLFLDALQGRRHEIGPRHLLPLCLCLEQPHHEGLLIRRKLAPVESRFALFVIIPLPLHGVVLHHKLHRIHTRHLRSYKVFASQFLGAFLALLQQLESAVCASCRLG
mmetsp:Transcript_10045/g.29020  ORF Transcript_10045/g.29020 Transcript_10045/m.29020 type:complete len:217 (+) Transcript_10045:3167-3817(+)